MPDTEFNTKVKEKVVLLLEIAEIDVDKNDLSKIVESIMELDNQKNTPDVEEEKENLYLTLYNMLLKDDDDDGGQDLILEIMMNDD